MNEHSDFRRLGRAVRDNFPKPTPSSVEFGEQFVSLPGSARTSNFRIDVAPWLRRPLNDWDDISKRITTLVKPVQTGGSTAGEVVICKTITHGRGFLQYNWSNDKRAKERWESRIEKILKACPPVLGRILQNPKELTKQEFDFGRGFFRMQGVFVPDNLDSDTIKHQVNEEIHSWEPGHLAKARNRLSAVSLGKSFDISNASKIKDQLHEAFMAGTQQYWEVFCPGCRKFHRMRTRWEDKRPDLGGLRYDADGARRPGGYYDYNKIKSTLRFQMPCGFIVHNDPMERRALSESGDYSKPENDGADGSHTSYTYEAVSVDFIDWLQLVKDKHDALRALRLGDPAPWMRYRTEKECIWYDPNENPVEGGLIVLNTEIKKTREGLPDPKIRLGQLDRQQGEKHKGEFPYWWVLVRDYSIKMTDKGPTLWSRLVHESREETDDNAARVMKDLQVNPWLVVADSGDDTTHVYMFCLRHGFNALKGGKEALYSHPDGSRKIYSADQPLHAMVNRPPIYPYVRTKAGMEPDPREPCFILYSKFGIRERFHYIRTQTIFETPSDVSEDYQKHMDSEERRTRKHPRTNEEINEWIQVRDRNDQFVNECYAALQVDRAGLIAAEATKRKEDRK